MTFKPHEIDFLRQAELGRLATIQPNGTPQNSPVGFTYNERTGHHRHRRLSDVEEPEVPQHRPQRQGGVRRRRHHLARPVAGALPGDPRHRRAGRDRRVARGGRRRTGHRRSSGSRRGASSASASTTRTSEPHLLKMDTRDIARRRSQRSRFCDAARQRRHRARLVDRQVRQHRRGQAAGPLAQPAEHPARRPR